METQGRDPFYRPGLRYKVKVVYNPIGKEVSPVLFCAIGETWIVERVGTTECGQGVYFLPEHVAEESGEVLALEEDFEFIEKVGSLDRILGEYDYSATEFSAIA